MSEIYVWFTLITEIAITFISRMGSWMQSECKVDCICYNTLNLTMNFSFLFPGEQDQDSQTAGWTGGNGVRDWQPSNQVFFQDKDWNTWGWYLCFIAYLWFFFFVFIPFLCPNLKFFWSWGEHVSVPSLDLSESHEVLQLPYERKHDAARHCLVHTIIRVSFFFHVSGVIDNIRPV